MGTERKPRSDSRTCGLGDLGIWELGAGRLGLTYTSELEGISL